MPLTLALTLSLLLGAAVLGQQDGTCTTSGGQFGNQLTTCRRGALVCTTEAHGGDAYREFYARSACVGPPPPTPTAAELLPEQAAGPPIPGRGGPRWEGDDGR
jgi:hypothetical protein